MEAGEGQFKNLKSHQLRLLHKYKNTLSSKYRSHVNMTNSLRKQIIMCKNACNFKIIVKTVTLGSLNCIPGSNSLFQNLYK
jgi:hypothetical protein